MTRGPRGTAKKRVRACAYCGRPFKRRELKYVLTGGRFCCEACLGAPRRDPIV